MDTAQSLSIVSSPTSIKLRTSQHLTIIICSICLLVTSALANTARAQEGVTYVPYPPATPGVYIDHTTPIKPYESQAECNWYRNWQTENDQAELSQCYVAVANTGPSYPWALETSWTTYYTYVFSFLDSQLLPYGPPGTPGPGNPPTAGTVEPWIQFLPGELYTNGLNYGDGGNCNGGDGTDPLTNDNSNNSGSGSSATADPINCATLNGATTAGDPINFATGNYYLQEDDYVASKWLRFSRFYNSQSELSGSVGANWTDSFDKSLVITGSPATNITMFRPDGKFETFSKSNGVWSPSVGITDSITEVDNADGVATQYVVFLPALKHHETYIPITLANGTVTGQLQSITDETGQGVTLTYSTSTTPPADTLQPGLLINVTDSQGRQLNFTYNLQGYVSKITLPDEGTIVYTYDPTMGNLTAVQFPDGSTRQYVYNEQNLTGGYEFYNTMTGIIDETGTRYESTSYGESGYIVAYQTSFAGGVGTTYAPQGSTGTYVYYPLGGYADIKFGTVNGLNKVTSVTAPCGPQCGQPWASRTYDTNNNPATYTDFNGNVTATTYNNLGLLTQEIDAKGQSTQRTITTTWDTTLINPLQRTVTDVNSNLVQKTSWVYNSMGEPTARCEIDTTVSAAVSYTCSATGTVPAGVRRWTYTYCTAVGSGCPLTGLLLTSTGPRTDLTQTTTYTYYTTASATSCGTPGAACYQPGDVHTITDALGHVTTIASYDADGRITRSTDANGINTDSTYYPRGWIKTRTVGGAETSYTYTAYGAIQTVTDPDGIATTYGYDAAHRLTKITDALGNYILYTLDAAGDKTAEQYYDASGTVHKSLSRTFNTLGQLASVLDGLQKTIFTAEAVTSYDDNGNLVQSTDGLGFLTEKSYDGLNRLKQTIENYEGTNAATENTTTTYTYDFVDRLTEVTDPSGLNTTYSYDGLSDAKGQVSPDTGSTSRTFDAAGDNLTQTDAKGITATSTYDALNRRITTSYPVTSLDVTYKYDEANSTTGCSSSDPIGRLTRIIESAVTTVFCYDQRGNVIEKAQTIGSTKDTTGYSVSAAGRLTGIVYPSGTLATYTRDGDGRIKTITVTPTKGAEATVVSSVTYEPFGPVSGYELGNSQTIVRTYDANYRLTDLTSPAFNLHVARDVVGDVTAIGNAPGASPATETYAYDPLYRLTSVTEASGTVLESATYNETGDRLTKSGSGLATGAYGYNTGTHQLIATGTAARTVDADGNTTAMSQAGSTYGFGYSDRNQMTVAQLAGSTIATYTLNALSERVEKVTSSATERYDYNETSQILGEYGADERDYIWMGGIPVANVDTSGTTSTIAYVTSDQLGTPRAVANSSGTTEWQLAYQGNPWSEVSPTSSTGYTYNLRFPGQYFDAETELNYNINRDYDSATGRYIESDPVGLLGGISTYAYVGGNPLSKRDPLGLDGFGDMQGAFCPGGLCTLPPEMVQNSWGTPNMAPVYMMDGAAVVASGGTALPFVSDAALPVIANTLLAANVLNGAIEVPEAIVTGTMPTADVLSEALEYIGESFETEPPPPPTPVPTQPVAAPLAMPAGNQTTCPQ